MVLCQKDFAHWLLSVEWVNSIHLPLCLSSISCKDLRAINLPRNILNKKVSKIKKSTSFETYFPLPIRQNPAGISSTIIK